jgi:hypothetical protein
LKNRFIGKVASLGVKAASYILPSQLDKLRKQQMEIEINDWVADRYKVPNQELSEAIGIDLSLFGY